MYTQLPDIAILYAFIGQQLQAHGSKRDSNDDKDAF